MHTLVSTVEEIILAKKQDLRYQREEIRNRQRQLDDTTKDVAALELELDCLKRNGLRTYTERADAAPKPIYPDIELTKINTDRCR